MGALMGAGIVTRQQLADELGVTEQTVKLWEDDGLPVHHVGNQRYYDVDEVVKFIKRRRG